MSLMHSAVFFVTLPHSVWCLCLLFQVLLVNLVTSVTLGLSLAVEPAEPDVMNRCGSDPLDTVDTGPAVKLALIHYVDNRLWPSSPLYTFMQSIPLVEQATV